MRCNCWWKVAVNNRTLDNVNDIFTAQVVFQSDGYPTMMTHSHRMLSAKEFAIESSLAENGPIQHDANRSDKRILYNQTKWKKKQTTKWTKKN